MGDDAEGVSVLVVLAMLVALLVVVAIGPGAVSEAVADLLRQAFGV